MSRLSLLNIILALLTEKAFVTIASEMFHLRLTTWVDEFRSRVVLHLKLTF